MVFNNPEVLIKMKADIGMKDPPTLAVFNVQDIPLKGEHFLRSGAFILIAYRKAVGGKKKKQNDLQRHDNSPAPHMCSVNRWLDSWTSYAHVYENSTKNAFQFCESAIYCNFFDRRNWLDVKTHIFDSPAAQYSVQRSHLIPSCYND